MAKDALVTDELAKKFATEKDTPYARWVAAEGLDVIAAHWVPDLRTVELKPWARRGGSGVFINHEASRTSNDCYVAEIPAGGALAPQRQLFEEMTLVLEGHGSTRVWNDAGQEVTFEWGKDSLFAIPLNAHHQHVNGSGSAPARFVSSTNLPPIINLYEDPEFVFGTAHDFPSRFAGESDYFADGGVQEGLLLRTNFVADAVGLPLVPAKERGAGGGHIRFSMARGSMNSHISQFPTATYKKGHRHGPGAHVIVLSGTGFSLMWPEGEEPRRYDWHAGSMIVPPNMWFHQHFNTGTEPARYLAFKHEGVSIRNAQGVPKAWISQRVGGDQIDYADESALVRDTFAKALAEHGLSPKMDEAYERELEDLPPRPLVVTEQHAHDDHVHDGGEHDHDHVDDAAGDLADNPIWQQENVTLASVGIDVGSAGTQVAFSRLHLRRRGDGLTTRYVVVERTTLFESPLHLTPYLADGRIDAEALGGLVDQAYAGARQRPEDVDTGVVILTGEALRRRNAEPIATVLAERAGDLVCATAGHHMEATLAAYGSGAALESWSRQGRVLSVDIGGGTTKLAVVDRGEVVATAALDVGGRLVVVDDEHRVVRLDPAGAAHAARVGLSPTVGSVLDEAALDVVADAMAEAVVRAVASAADPDGEPVPSDVLDLYVTPPLPGTGELVGVVFSGGVGEYVYDREDRDFGDLGRRLGAALRRRVDRLPAPLLPATECIRATVLGASQHSVQLSGSTCTITAPERSLPLRSVPVLRPRYDLPPVDEPGGHEETRRRVGDAVRARLAAHVTEDRHDDDVAIALHFGGLPLHARVLAFAHGVVDGLGGRVERGLPLVLVLDADVARTLGHVLRDDVGVTNDLVVLDGVRLDDFDHIDLGRVRQPSGTVPVTIKSLVFSGVDVRALRTG